MLFFLVSRCCFSLHPKSLPPLTAWARRGKQIIDVFVLALLYNDHIYRRPVEVAACKAIKAGTLRKQVPVYRHRVTPLYAAAVAFELPAG